MILTEKEIAKALGSPLANVELYWPKMVQEMLRAGTCKLCFQVATLATIGVECRVFKPICEYGPREYFDKYNNRKDLGNGPGPDGYNYRGRGFVQLTGKANYARMSKVVNKDLVKNPDDALLPRESVIILLDFLTNVKPVYWWSQKAFSADTPEAEERCWKKIRRLVNGGLNGYDRFRDCVEALKSVA